MHNHEVRRRLRAQISGAEDAAKKISDGDYDNWKLCPPHGCVSVCGRRKEMEDATAVVPSFVEFGSGAPLHFFAVYDGHGGARAAVLCKERLHGLLASDLSGATGGFDMMLWRRAATASFARMDAEICDDEETRNNDGEAGGAREMTDGTVGTTAVVVVIGGEKIAVANCGDSRAVLSRGGRAVPLTLDHKPDRADEMARIEAAGGHVIFWNGYRVLGVLATSRSIGDRYLKPYVVADPEVTFIGRCPDDEFLIIASDGLWDVVSNETACRVARRCLAGRVQNGNGLLAVEEKTQSPTVMAAALLTKMAIARGSSDNISVVVVDFSPYL